MVLLVKLLALKAGDASHLWVQNSRRHLLPELEIVQGLRRRNLQAAAGAVVPLQDATRLGNTSHGAWVFKQHRLISLPETHTATEIYFWYMHCMHAKKVIKKRSHPKGSQDRRDAAKLRHREQGRWGFPR